MKKQCFFSKCPCCNSLDISFDVQVYQYKGKGVNVCNVCTAVFGSLYKADVYKVVALDHPLITGTESDNRPWENTRYFFINVVKVGCTSSVHGWMDRFTQRVFQIG